jgi:8-oxo-dGTP pyrophosphatase MutT (NUDIX family)
MDGAPRPYRNVTSVGGLVMRGPELLVVRMTYGPTRGRYMLPGGLLDPGETRDQAVVREVWEEAAVEARPLGIAGVRSRVDGVSTDNYVIWLLEHVAGEPAANGGETDDARYLPFDELAVRDDVAALVQYLAGRLARGELKPHSLVEDYAYQTPGTTPATWKLFM